jgi:hypothetical protein
MKKYAIFESNEDEAKCLALFDSFEEAQEAIEDTYTYPAAAVIYVCTEKQQIGESLLH